MTRRLLLMRHAKSDWDVPGLNDKDRPLNARGRSTAPRMATWAFEQGDSPDLLLCSSATRTKQTVELMIEQWKLLQIENSSLVIPQTVIEERLYLAADSDILSIARTRTQQLKEAQCIWLIGHNPGLENLASTLSGTHVTMPTAAIAIFRPNTPNGDWPDDWSNANLWNWRGLVKPREIGGETI